MLDDKESEFLQPLKLDEASYDVGLKKRDLRSRGRQGSVRAAGRRISCRDAAAAVCSATSISGAY
jgi:hypothetical protein